MHSQDENCAYPHLDKLSGSEVSSGGTTLVLASRGALKTPGLSLTLLRAGAGLPAGRVAPPGNSSYKEGGPPDISMSEPMTREEPLLRRHLGTGDSVVEHVHAIRNSRPDDLLIAHRTAPDPAVHTPAKLVNAGADLVIDTSGSSDTSITWVRNHPIIRLGTSVASITGAAALDLAWQANLLRSTAATGGLELRLYASAGDLPDDAAASVKALEVVYQKALSRSARPQTFLEQIDVRCDDTGPYLAIELTETGTLNRRPFEAPSTGAEWDPDSLARFTADPRLLTTPRVLRHELERRGANPEAITRNFLIAKFETEEHGYFLSSSHRSPYTAVKAVGDKSVARQILSANGLSVAQGEYYASPDMLEQALEFLNRVPRVVVKPVDSAQGKGVTIGVASPEALRSAWLRAFESTKSGVLVEQFFSGVEARFAVVGNNCVAVTRRRPPTVYGDGNSTIRQLINRKNRHRRSNPHLANRPILLDPTRLARMAADGLNPLSVLAEDEEYIIDPNAGYYGGAETVDITDQVHPSYKQLAVRALHSIPGLPVAGLDVMMSEYAQPANEDNYIIIEVNSQPGLGLHHFPVHGQARNVAGAIIDNLTQGRHIKAFHRSRHTSASEPMHIHEHDTTAVALSREFDNLGFTVSWLAKDYFHAHRDSISTAIWGSYTALSGKSAVIATRQPRVARELLTRKGLPVTLGWRAFPRDTPKRGFSNGEKAWSYASSLQNPTLRAGGMVPIAIDSTDPATFKELWRSLSLRARRGIIVEEQPPGSTYRFLVAYDSVMSVVPFLAKGASPDFETDIHGSYRDVAVRAVSAFSGLDIADVYIAAASPALPADPSNHVVLTVQAGPSLAEHIAAAQENSSLLREIVTRHVSQLEHVVADTAC